MTAPLLILASTSAYRRDLLGRLRLPFEVRTPGVDETPAPGETPPDLAIRLALAKARAVAAQMPGAVVIGSDQVADLEGEPLGKPGDHAGAVRQLRRMSGRRVVFHTAVAVAQGDRVEQDLVTVTVRLRQLADAEIESYLRRDTPYDCAGSAKVESLGIALLASVESADPTALIGLPLIATCALLRRFGIDPLGASA